MKTSIVFTVAVMLITATTVDTKAQGCVAVRHFSSCSGNSLESNFLRPGEWQAGINYRYFESFRHFSGTEEHPNRIANGTQVINDSHAWDLTFSYGLTNRLFANVTLPFVINARSSLYEHGRTERNTTFSRGLADMRVGLGYWLLPEQRYRNGNIALGAAIKLPTGNHNATDIFYNVGLDGQPQVRPVDQSIQPGDGGFGAAFDFQFYHRVVGGLSAYGGGFYLVNPRETNGIRTFRETLNPILENEAIMSVPDQYAVRAGVSHPIHLLGLGASLGARFEGVPVEDLLGGSAGFRRPGNALSIEPGISYMKDGLSINFAVPLALRRNRPQSVTDIENTNLTGEYRRGDAAFADYLVSFGITYRPPRPSNGTGAQPTTW